MTLRHIKIFLAVCQHDCNTTKAAKALLMTQPAVSLAIRELEEYYGVRLFDRIGRRLNITEAGQQFLSYGSHITALFDDMEKGLRNWDALGLLRVGASITIGAQLLPNYIRAFYAQYPGKEIQAVVEPSERLEQKIMDNTLDLALLERTVHSPLLVSLDYMDDRLVIIAPADGRYHPGQIVPVEQFRKERFLLREQGSGTREEFDRAAAAAGFSVTPTWEAMSTTALINGVISGLGVAVLPERMLTAPLEEGLVVPIQVEGMEMRRKFHIVYHKDKFLTPSAQAFIKLCQSYEQEHPDAPYHGLY